MRAAIEGSATAVRSAIHGEALSPKKALIQRIDCQTAEQLGVEIGGLLRHD